MTSRDAIMQRIRTGLGNAAAAGSAGLPPPPVPEVWPPDHASHGARSDPEVLAQRFAQELSAVHGETIRAATMAEARRRLAELLDTAGWTPLGVVDRPLAREVTADLPPSGSPGSRPMPSPAASPSCPPDWSRPSACWPIRARAPSTARRLRSG